ncbi:MAG: hypothetical protein IPH13_01095 [Planctomycetes bacterium]|nr:hypothetical protein [Planctomycetota bacterium]
MKPHLALAFAAALAAAPLAVSATLTVDGGSTTTGMIGDSIDFKITGPAGAHVIFLLDVAPGSIVVSGVNIPLAGTPALLAFDLGTLGPSGELAFPATVPLDPTLAGAEVWLAVVTQSGPLVESSAAAKVTVVDRVVQLAGNPLAQYPHFEFVDAFNETAPISFALDTTRFPFLLGQTADLYVVPTRTKAQWLLNPTLLDVSASGFETITFGPTIQSNVRTLDPGALSGTVGTEFGIGYDIVVDVDRNGVLGGLDLIDGYGDRAGAVVVRDFSLPGPLAVTEILYSGGTFLGQDTYYPTNIASMGKLPVVVVSHGNGHNYQWYDHIGNQLASWGYVVMSHQNNTSPGIETASTTTLTNTEFLFANQATINGGVLAGHLDQTRIAWIGHSRGGEGVVRAYDRVFDGQFVPVNFTLASIKLVSSIAPTNFLGAASTDPHFVNYHLWVGNSDNDVNGCALDDQLQWYQILNRARSTRMSTALYGAGHADFHDGGGSSVAAGPCLIGRANAHQIMRGYLVPLMKSFMEDEEVAREFLWRQYESFHPVGAPVSNACVTVNLQYRPFDDDRFVVDDFQGNTSLTVSSSGAPVVLNVSDSTEGAFNDNTTSFTNLATDPMNGMTQSGAGGGTSGLVLSFDGAANYSARFDVPVAGRNASEFAYLSFRAAQATRHPLTTAALGDLTFDVTLRDTSGHQATIRIDSYGGGIEEPYQRLNCGTGTGWNNEFETIRIRLTDFTTSGSLVDLRDVAAVVFDFGPAHGSVQGRIGIDDIEFVN